MWANTALFTIFIARKEYELVQQLKKKKIKASPQEMIPLDTTEIWKTVCVGMKHWFL